MSRRHAARLCNGPRGHAGHRIRDPIGGDCTLFYETRWMVSFALLSLTRSVHPKPDTHCAMSPHWHYLLIFPPCMVQSSVKSINSKFRFNWELFFRDVRIIIITSTTVRWLNCCKIEETFFPPISSFFFFLPKIVVAGLSINQKRNLALIRRHVRRCIRAQLSRLRTRFPKKYETSFVSSPLALISTQFALLCSSPIPLSRFFSLTAGQGLAPLCPLCSCRSPVAPQHLITSVSRLLMRARAL